MDRIVRIAVFVSGGGTNLQALIDNAKSGNLPGTEISLVISSRADAFALKRAGRAGIRFEVFARKDFPDEDSLTTELISTLKKSQIDLIVLAGYMSILQPQLVREFPRRIINIHPSLIPKHCGKGFYGQIVHEAVIAAGDLVSGATVHYVDEGIDTGEIIIQREVPVEAGDNAETLAARVLIVEHQILPEAVRIVTKQILSTT